MNPMRIVHLLASVDPKAGGPPAVVLRIAAGQAALGHDVTVAHLPLPADREPDFRRSCDAVPGIARVRFATVDPAMATTLGRPRAAPSFGRCDMLHIHGVWEPVLPACARWARAQGIPYCFVPHGMLDRWSMAQKKWKKRVALWLGWKAVLDRAAFLHVLNEDEGRGLAPLGLRAPFETIANGVFLSEIEPVPARGSFRAKRPELGNDPYVLFLSRLHFKKGLDHLADAFAILVREHPAVRLVVAGPDDGERAPFEARIAGHGLASRTHVVGPLYGRDKYEALADCAAFCLPSRQEGFSVAVTEALALARPVVISTECHFPEVAEVGAGAVTSLDPADVAKALARFIADPAMADAAGARGAALVRERFTWEAIAARTIEVYARHGVR